MTFNPNRDIKDLSGKVILVTGGNSGLRKEPVFQMAKHDPYRIVMASRSQSKAEAAIKEIQLKVPGARIDFLSIDLSSFDSIRKAAATVLQRYDRLDILLNNAGIMGADPGLTEDGYELQFGSNHVGPALLTKILLPLLKKTSDTPGGDVRIIQLSSEAHQFGPKRGILFDRLKTPCDDLSGRARYGQSKLANLYFIKALAERHPSIKCASLHPGLVKTNIADTALKSYPYISWFVNAVIELVCVDVETGALGQLWASTGNAAEIKSGAYYTPLKKEVKHSSIVSNNELAEKLWKWTEQEFIVHRLRGPDLVKTTP